MCFLELQMPGIQIFRFPDFHPHQGHRGGRPCRVPRVVVQAVFFIAEVIFSEAVDVASINVVLTDK